LIPALLIVALLSVAGCGGKKTPPASSYSTAPEVAAPTAHISANPLTILAGDSVELSWNTSNANTVRIDGIGDVPSSGKRTVSPTESTTFRVVAHGDGGNGEDSVRVTVNRPQGDNDNNGNYGSGSEGPQLSAAEEQLFHSSIEDAFYGYDAYKLDEAAQAVLAKDAAFLVKYPRYHVVIGGYCDERGSSEYNLALGQNRSESAKKALVAAGVGENRIRVVSYGKEKPFCTVSSEDCWAKNRRAGFALDNKQH
jgi:peptidoglycan-associated lipoprotein